MMQMGVTPRECPRAGVQLPWDGSCCKIRKVRGLVPDQLASAKMLCHCCAAKEVQAPSALVVPQKNLHSWAGTHLSSVVVIQEGLGFLSLQLFERSGRTRKLALKRKLSNCTVLTNVQRQQTTKAWRKWGALCPPLCFSVVGISGVRHRETRRLQTALWYLHFIFH